MSYYAAVAVFFDDDWNNRPSEEAYPCSPRGTGAKRCGGLSSAENQLMNEHWVINMQAVKNATVEKGGFTWQVKETTLGPLFIQK